jgi:hypothetical protein
MNRTLIEGIGLGSTLQNLEQAKQLVKQAVVLLNKNRRSHQAL